MRTRTEGPTSQLLTGLPRMLIRHAIGVKSHHCCSTAGGTAAGVLPCTSRPRTRPSGVQWGLIALKHIYIVCAVSLNLSLQDILFYNYACTVSASWCICLPPHPPPPPTCPLLPLSKHLLSAQCMASVNIRAYCYVCVDSRDGSYRLDPATACQGAG